jgi:hypothetical protein
MRRNKPITTKAYRAEMVQILCEEALRGPHWDGLNVVEVGVYEGKLGQLLCVNPSVASYIIVDQWKSPYMHFDQEHMDKVAATCKAWAAEFPKVDVWHMSSVEGANLVPDGSVDFWHTDGDHGFDGITTDIEAWLPKMKLGGLMTGDNLEIDTVRAGVEKCLPGFEECGKGRIWTYRVS